MKSGIGFLEKSSGKLLVQFDIVHTDFQYIPFAVKRGSEQEHLRGIDEDWYDTHVTTLGTGC